MRVLIVNNGRNPPLHSLNLFRDHGCEVVAAPLLTATYPVADYDLIVLTGSNHNPIRWNEERLQPLLEWITTLTVPTIGICYGAQLLATAFGGSETLCDTGEKFRDFVDVSPLPGTTWSFAKETYCVYEAHRWNIVSLPAVLEPLITTPRGVALFAHLERPLVGFQFHPEKHHDETDGRLLLNVALAQLGLPIVVTN